MKERILRLCKRLNKFTLDEISTIADDVEESVLELLLLTLTNEKRLIKQGNTYFYNKKVSMNKQTSKLPQFFQFHSNEIIKYMLKGFCADIEVLKMIDLFDLTKHVLNKFYPYFRTLIYEKQKVELLEYFEKNPKVGQERIYMNSKAYLYLYCGKLYVSDKLLKSENSKKHTETERLEIKKIYLRSFRKVLSRSFTHKFHVHVAEEVWKYEKDFKDRFKELSMILFA